LFSGDTLFPGSCGRVDLKGGCKEDMVESLQSRLGAVSDQTIVYPGHEYGGEWTSIGREKKRGFLKPVGAEGSADDKWRRLDQCRSGGGSHGKKKSTRRVGSAAVAVQQQQQGGPKKTEASSSGNAVLPPRTNTVGGQQSWAAIFRHTGPMPPAPQAIDQLQFILGQKPLNMHIATPPPPQSVKQVASPGMEVRTAAEARQKATQQLENLHTIVQNASAIMTALSNVARDQLQHKDTSKVMVALDDTQNVNRPVEEETKDTENGRQQRANATMLLAMFLSGGGVGAYFGSLLLSANIV
ncbi:hypothetical protein EV175_005739, partial [Coemansia sp. RSA 1933]